MYVRTENLVLQSKLKQKAKGTSTASLDSSGYWALVISQNSDSGVESKMALNVRLAMLQPQPTKIDGRACQPDCYLPLQWLSIEMLLITKTTDSLQLFYSFCAKNLPPQSPLTGSRPPPPNSPTGSNDVQFYTLMPQREKKSPQWL